MPSLYQNPDGSYSDQVNWGDPYDTSISPYEGYEQLGLDVDPNTGWPAPQWGQQAYQPPQEDPYNLAAILGYDPSLYEPRGGDGSYSSAPSAPSAPYPSGVSGGGYDTTGGVPPRPNALPFHEDDPAKMYPYAFHRAVGMGDALDQGLRDTIGRYQNREGNFLDWQLGGPGGYRDILEGRGGYSTDEQGNLLQRGMLESGMASEDELRQLGLSDDEISRIMGNPYEAKDALMPELYNTSDMQSANNAIQRGIYSGVHGWLNSAVDPNALRLNPNFGANTRGIIDRTAQRYSEIADPRKLGLSDEYMQDYKFGPDDQQRMVQRAGTTIGNLTRSRQEEIARRANAGGYNSPMAMATAMNRLGQTGDINAADARLAAEIQAKQLGLDVSQGREDTRLGAERYLANLGLETEADLADRYLGQANLEEQMRMGAERDLSSRLQSNALNYGRMALDTERGIAQGDQDVARFRINTGANLIGGAESEAARRAALASGMRRDAQGNLINTRYGQRYPAANFLRSGYGSIYGQRKSEEQEGRDWLTNQQQMGQYGAQSGWGNRISAFGSTSGAMGGAASGAGRYQIDKRSTPGTFDKIIGAGVGALAGFGG